MLRVIHFEIYADKPIDLENFYTKIFNWEFKKWNGPEEYWLIMTGKDAQGIDGGMSKGRETVQKKGIGAYVCTIDVPDIDSFSQKILDNGGKTVMEKVGIPYVGWLAYFKDPDGNMFGIIQEDKSVK